MTSDPWPPPGVDGPTSGFEGGPGEPPGQRLGDRLRRWFLGPVPVDRLTATHCVHSAAESFFVVSMAGSIFFSVSVAAARPRVLLFLVLTLAPFLVMAPLIGPIVDRVRGGLGSTLMATFALRALLAVVLAEHLRTLLLFPLAFGVLVVAKTYTVARNALVPSLVPVDDDLVSANARLSRSATIVGAVAAAVAVTVYTQASGSWTLRIGALVYVVGAWFAWRVRASAEPVRPMERDAYVELVRPDVSGAVADMMVLRAAIGFALFQFGFSLRADGAPAWVIGGVILANGAGGFAGTIVSPWLRRHLSERGMFTAALTGATVATGLAGVVFAPATVVVAIAVLNLGVSVGRRALDATIQRQAPHARRGQVYAMLETRLELVWVLAACLAVALRVATWIGVLFLASFLAITTVIHLRSRIGLSVMRPLSAVPLPERLLLRAESLADHRFYDEAIAVALAALDVAPGAPVPPPLSPDRRSELVAADEGAQREAAREVIDAVRATLAERSRG